MQPDHECSSCKINEFYRLILYHEVDMHWTLEHVISNSLKLPGNINKGFGKKLISATPNVKKNPAHFIPDLAIEMTFRQFRKQTKLLSLLE